MLRSFLIILIILFSFSIIYCQEVIHLSLDAAITLAHEKNPILHIQEKEKSAQKGFYWINMMPADPEIGIEIEGVPEGESYSNYEAKKLFFKQSIDFPTNYIFKHRLFNAKIQQSQYQIDQFKRNLSFIVKKSYFNILLQKELLNLGKSHLDLFEEFYQKTKRSYELGESNRLNMLRAKVNWSSSKKEYKDREKNLEVAKSEFREILGFKHYEIEKIALTDSLPLNVKFFSSEKSMENLKKHPALSVAETAVRVASNARSLSIGSLLPGLHFSYFKQKLNKHDLWGGEIGLSIPLWFMRHKGDIQQKNAELSKSKSELSAEQLRIRREYDQAVSRFEKAMNEVELYQTELLQEAEETFRIAKRSYDIGEIGYLEYIDAQQILIHTREGYLESLFSYQVEKANLTSLTGVEF